MTPWHETRSRLNRRLEELREERAGFLDLWRELSDHVQPYRGRFLGRDERPNDGRRRDGRIVDNKATRALRILAAGMQGGLTSPARPWFRFTTPDPEMMERQSVRLWFGTVESLLRDIFGRSNLYNALHGVYVELGLFGTGGLIVRKDFDDVVRARPLTAGEAMFDQGPRMIVDTIFRECKMTVRQVVEQFGVEAVSPRLRDRHDGGAVGEWIDVVHVIEPNPDHDPRRASAAAKPWREWYYEAGGDEGEPLALSGYDEFPAMVPRWDVVGADVYGRSPGMETLADVKMLQALQTRILQAIDKNTNPPLAAPAAMKGQVVNSLPGGVNFVIPGQGPSAISPLYQPSIAVRDLEFKVERVQQAIAEGFHADLFAMLAGAGGKTMTAFEVAERYEEKLLLLGPVLERLQHELLNPLIGRVFGICRRAGILPPVPRVLRGVDFKIDYISVLAQAQKMLGGEAIRKFTSHVGALAPLDRAMLDKIDFDQVVDELAATFGVPAGIVRSDDAVARLRGKRNDGDAPAGAPGGAAAAATGLPGMAGLDPAALSGVMRGLGQALSGGAGAGGPPTGLPPMAAK